MKFQLQQKININIKYILTKLLFFFQFYIFHSSYPTIIAYYSRLQLQIAAALAYLMKIN